MCSVAGTLGALGGAALPLLPSCREVASPPRPLCTCAHCTLPPGARFDRQHTRMRAEGADGGEGFFDGLPTPPETPAELSPRVPAPPAAADATPCADAQPAQQEATPGEAEALIERSLFVGNYAAAVDECLKVRVCWSVLEARGESCVKAQYVWRAVFGGTNHMTSWWGVVFSLVYFQTRVGLPHPRPFVQVGRMADALLIASIAGDELWRKALATYMRRQPRPYMRVVQAVLDSDLKGAF